MAIDRFNPSNGCISVDKVSVSVRSSYWGFRFWLVVSTPLKNMSQIKWLFQYMGKLNMFQTTNQDWSVMACDDLPGIYPSQSAGWLQRGSQLQCQTYRGQSPHGAFHWTVPKPSFFGNFHGYADAFRALPYLLAHPTSPRGFNMFSDDIYTLTIWRFPEIGVAKNHPI